MVTISGAEFKKFYNDTEWWPEGVYHDDASITVDGKDAYQYEKTDLDKVPDESIITLDGGIVTDIEGIDHGSLDSYFKKWKKTQTTKTLLLEVKKEDVDKLLQVIKDSKIKVKVLRQ
jgi:hypothetical protein